MPPALPEVQFFFLCTQYFIDLVVLSLGESDCLCQYFFERYF